MSKHYDVVILGAGIGALSAAALLARRSWRVLVLGQGFRPAGYSFDGLPLARRPFTFVGGSSPAWRRVLTELAQSQSFRRHVPSAAPMVQVLAPRVRPPPPRPGALRSRDRPGVPGSSPGRRRPLRRSRAGQRGQRRAFDRDLVWSPGTFWERRETARAGALPYLSRAGTRSPRGVPSRALLPSVVEAPALRERPGGRLPPLALARLHGAWTRGVSELARGEPDLVDFLGDRVHAPGARRGSAVAPRTSAPARKGHRSPDRGRRRVDGVQFVVTTYLAGHARPGVRLPAFAEGARRAPGGRSMRSASSSSLLVRDDGCPPRSRPRRSSSRPPTRRCR